MFIPNPIMLQAGYLPAALVARVLHKAVSTIHRMVSSGRVAGVRDGVALYVQGASLEAYFAAQHNHAMVEQVQKVLKDVASNRQPKRQGHAA